MVSFLFASIAVPAHTTNPLPIAARLVERGHDVRWYAGRAFHDRIRAVGAHPIPYSAAVDFSEGDLLDHFPQLRGSGPRIISRAFADVFIGQARQRVSDLQAILADRPADAMLTEGLSFGVGFTSELGGPPWATFGDGPLGFAEPDTPPFGPGLTPMAGSVGRLRNRLVTAVADRIIFREPQRVYDTIRQDLGLPPAGSALDGCFSPYLHVQGCTPSFEYPRRHLPGHVHWVGAFRPDPPRDWAPPTWWGDLDRAKAAGTPVIHVTQGSIRPDPRELMVPTLRALADRDALVVVTTGGPTVDQVGEVLGSPLPSNARITPFIPYSEVLSRADLFVTNGGYSGVTLALAHGVPMVQAGTTEEKAEIAARITWSGVGVSLGTSRPSVGRVAGGVQRVLADDRFAAAARRIADEMAGHDAGREGADLLEQLAATRKPVLRSSVAA